MTRTRERNVLSWKDGHATAAIVDFVKLVTTKRGIDFVAEADRIAVFDNDGTLWCEQPFYFQGLFAFDRIKALAPQHPEWKEHQPFKAVLDDERSKPPGHARASLFARYEGARRLRREGLVETRDGFTRGQYHCRRNDE